MAEKLATLTDRDRYWLRQQELWEKSSMITSKAAIRDHFKTGHSGPRPGQ